MKKKQFLEIRSAPRDMIYGIKEDSFIIKFGKPCKKCKGYHTVFSTSGSNTASGSRKEKCEEQI